MLEPVRTTCLDIAKPEIQRGYGHLPKDKMYEWAAYQAALSVDYLKTGKGNSATPDTAFCKRQMMEKLQNAFKTRGNPEDWGKYRDLFDKHLEDPGTLENFRYFCVPDSDEMIMFYISIWTGDMASAMEFLHRYGKDLKGNRRESPENEAWWQMTEYEGIAVNEHLKAQAIADLIEVEGVDRACFFGGGNLPERLYDGCLYGVKVTLFETGRKVEVDDLEFGGEDALPCDRFLFPDDVVVYDENLLKAANHKELLNTQELVVMHGVSMYLGQNLDGMVAALENGRELLVNDGVMSFDYLLMTEGMKRTATAQHWPNAEKMKIFNTPDEALAEGCKTVELVNEHAGIVDAYFDIESAVVNLVEPWGPTSVRFLLRKYAR